MAQGIIDFARAGQLSIITPFCLAGAMAPVTVAGALTLQHAEALAGIALAQIGTRRRAGAVRQLLVQCRHEVRCAGLRHARACRRRRSAPDSSHASSASPGARAAAARPTSPTCRRRTRRSSACGARCSPAPTVCIHAAGWLEGGLSVSYEKLITDLEALQTIAETLRRRRQRRGFDRLRRDRRGAAGRPFLLGRPHHGALPHRLLRAAGRRPLEFRQLERRTAASRRPNAPTPSGSASSPISSRRPGPTRPPRSSTNSSGSARKRGAQHRSRERRGRRVAASAIGEIRCAGILPFFTGEEDRRQGDEGQRQAGKITRLATRTETSRSPHPPADTFAPPNAGEF